ncbi:hypothetical protein HAX54_007349 [Datura stramonium]|uniref:Uncharacterized protein n=1 Tax=Datura stramonium TaxID=4076 RepID=A0ABS8TDF8_DATST|nr:hypothetical protein [Datura stramonium]
MTLQSFNHPVKGNGSSTVTSCYYVELEIFKDMRLPAFDVPQPRLVHMIFLINVKIFCLLWVCLRLRVWISLLSNSLVRPRFDGHTIMEEHETRFLELVHYAYSDIAESERMGLFARLILSLLRSVVVSKLCSSFFESMDTVMHKESYSVYDQEEREGKRSRKFGSFNGSLYIGQGCYGLGYPHQTQQTVSVGLSIKDISRLSRGGI